MPISQANTTSNPTTASGEMTDPSKTISFSTTISEITLTSNITASLSCPSSIDAGSSGSGSLSVTAGESSISFTFNYLLGSYDVSLPSFTTPLGSIDVPVSYLGIGTVKARFTAQVSASVSSSPSGFVSPTSLTYTSATSKSLAISTGTLNSGSISVSSSYTYDGTIEIILATALGEVTVLGPYDINSAPGSDNLSTSITVNPPAAENESTGGGGCFIATATYGTSATSDLDTLRSFRDKVLMSNPLGKGFVDAYYSTSPPIADALKQDDGLRAGVMVFLVTPIVCFAKVVLSGLGLLLLGICSTGILLLLRKKRWLSPALKAIGLGALTAILLTSFIFLLGWFGYTYLVCATVAAWLLPTILPFSMGVVLFKLLKYE